MEIVFSRRVGMQQSRHGTRHQCRSYQTAKLVKVDRCAGRGRAPGWGHPRFFAWLEPRSSPGDRVIRFELAIWPGKTCRERDSGQLKWPGSLERPPRQRSE